MRDGRGRDSDRESVGLIGFHRQLFEWATDFEGNLFVALLCWFLLGCSAVAIASFLHGMQGSSCGVGWSEDPPFSYPRKAGCFVRSLIELVPDPEQGKKPNIIQGTTNGQN